MIRHDAAGVLTIRLPAIVVAALLGCALGLALIAPAARAGQWIQVSCVNPDGSAAPSEGWSGSLTSTGYGTTASTLCGPGSPMVADLSSAAAEPVGSAVDLTYAPPAGSTLIGGQVAVNLYGDGGGYNASGDTLIYEPAVAYPTDVLLQCADGLGPCSSSAQTPHDYAGSFTLPADLGGDLTVSASCGGAAGASCDSGGSENAWALGEVDSADLTLSNGAVPAASGFTGTVLSPGARGTAQLLFDASDLSGPGVYRVVVSVDGTSVYDGTPNPNDGECVAVGDESGTLLFDHQQPCPVTTAVDVPIDTSAFSDGSHELSVSVVDAAGNVATVFDQTITTSNPVLTPKPRRGIKAQFVVSWRWRGETTQLRWIAARRLPRTAHLSVRCAGRGCPRLTVRSEPAKRARRLLRALERKRFHSGDRLLITVSEPHHLRERIRFEIRDGHSPVARLLKP